jgi:hypothetical protein
VWQVATDPGEDMRVELSSETLENLCKFARLNWSDADGNRCTGCAYYMLRQSDYDRLTGGRRPMCRCIPEPGRCPALGGQA